MCRHHSVHPVAGLVCLITSFFWGCSGTPPANNCSVNGVAGAGAADPCPTGGNTFTVGGGASAGTSSTGASKAIGGSSNQVAARPSNNCAAN